MERANATVKSHFHQAAHLRKPFRVLTTDKSLAVYCAKLSEFSAVPHNRGKLQPRCEGASRHFHRKESNGIPLQAGESPQST